MSCLSVCELWYDLAIPNPSKLWIIDLYRPKAATFPIF